MGNRQQRAWGSVGEVLPFLIGSAVGRGTAKGGVPEGKKQQEKRWNSSRTGIVAFTTTTEKRNL